LRNTIFVAFFSRDGFVKSQGLFRRRPSTPVVVYFIQRASPGDCFFIDLTLLK